jgi:hypothetical protein
MVFYVTMLGVVLLVGSREVALAVRLGTFMLAALAHLTDALLVEVLFRVHQI